MSPRVFRRRLKSRSMNLRETARKLLKTDPRRAAVPFLARRIAALSPSARRDLQAAASRSLRRGQSADEAQRVCATKVLAALLPTSLPAIRRLIASSDGPGAYEIHFSLFCALSDLKHPAKIERTLLKLIRNYLLRAKGDRAMAAWMAGDLLGDHWPGVGAIDVLRDVALRARFRGGRAGALHGLNMSLSSSSVEVRHLAAEAIGDALRGKGFAPRELVAAARDRNMLVRVFVVEALGRIRAPRTRRTLWAALVDPSPLVRRYAASAIGEHADRRDSATLIRRLGRERSPYARLGYYEALFRLGRREYLRQIHGGVRNSNYRIRCAAANTLGALPLRKGERVASLSVLREALEEERTVAAASSQRATIRCLGRDASKIADSQRTR